jgi:pimeloyl-ACP methyl ester carboxylesterase
MIDQSFLLEIARCNDDARYFDVVFVHGLNGDARETWEPSKPATRHRLWQWISRKKSLPLVESSYWIASAFPNAGVWSLGYPASSTAWRGHAMPLPDRAKNILQLFHLKKLGTRPLVLIVHSLGGLLVKQIVFTARTQNNHQWEAIGNSVSGILFLATPHSGSFLASVVDVFRIVSRANWTIADLQPHEPHLRDLNEWFRSNFDSLGLRAHVLRESRKTSGVMVVDPTSADPGIASVRVIPVDKDHVNICKPESLEDQVFLEAKQFISDCVVGQRSGSGLNRSALPRPKHAVKRQVPEKRIQDENAEEETT